MKRSRSSCCDPATVTVAGSEEMEIPASVWMELEKSGGFATLAAGVPSPSELERMAKVHHALSEPLRLTILHLLRDQPLCVCIINRFMRLPGPNLSYHLNILKESGLISGEHQGNWIIYSLTERGRAFVEKSGSLSSAPARDAGQEKALSP